MEVVGEDGNKCKERTRCVKREENRDEIKVQRYIFERSNLGVSSLPVTVEASMF